MSAAKFFRDVATLLEDREVCPHGPVASPEDRQVAGQACVKLLGGDQDRARTLWKLVVDDCGGYMPRGAACALIRAAHTENLVADVEAPEPQA